MQWELQIQLRYKDTADTVGTSSRNKSGVRTDTAKKLCKTRTFISTSHKWLTLGITLELLHILIAQFLQIP